MRSLRFALIALCLAAPVAAQGNGFYDGRTIGTGLQFKAYSFGDGAQFEKASQVAIPVALVYPVNARLSLDIGTAYAMTSSTTVTEGAHSVSGLTDVQVRGAYTLGRDLAVLSLVVNLPTGIKFDSADAITAGAAASNFLLFPVNSYANGLSVTGGMGIAKKLGDWGVGIAGSFRWSDKYSPYTGSLSSLSYEPGLEGKVRVGADRDLGQGRVRVGLTFSTFGDDTYGAGTGSDTKYSPGNRFIAEGAYSWPGLGGTLSAYVWNYHRSAGAADTLAVRNGENILSAGFVARRPMGTNATFEPAIETRFWSYDQGAGGGKVVALVAGMRRRLNDQLSIVPSARVELGTLDLVGGSSASLTGFGASVFVRYGF